MGVGWKSVRAEHIHGTGSRYLKGCPDCQQMQRAQRKKYTSKERRDYDLKVKYTLTPAEYTAMTLTQDGVCAICHRPPGSKGFNVDHDHETGKVRGLLCPACNRGIGLLRDNHHLLARAANYLKEH